jgi:hypothetical protein
MPQATITVRVVGGALQYATAGDVAGVGASKHRVKKGTDVEWICPDGALGIQFAGNTSPFASGRMSLTAAQNTSTGFETTNKKKVFKYFVAVVQANPPLVMEDPELDVTTDPGGGGTRPKKKAAKKKKKR